MVIGTDNDQKTLATHVARLQAMLADALEHEARLRQAYDAECCQAAARDDAKLVATKQRLDVATSRIQGIREEIGQKQRLIDEIQGREADESRAHQAQENYRRANERLAESQAELARLKAEYSAMPETIAQGRFSEALRAFNEAKSACFKDQSD